MMKKTLFYSLALLMAFTFSMCKPTKENYTLRSPDKSLELTFTKSDKGDLIYSLKERDSTLIAPSKLGLSFVGQQDSLYHIVGVEYADTAYTWHQIWGENKDIQCQYQEMKVKLLNKNKEQLNILFRLFNDGLGFRYEYTNSNNEPNDSIVVRDEYSEINVASNGLAWWNPANFDTYELQYQNDSIYKVMSANTPISMKLDNGTYISLHEAALTDYPDMALLANKGHFKAFLASRPNGTKAMVYGKSMKTPWRTIQVGHNAVDLINSSLILNLNEPCAIQGDLSWCKPMKYIGIWWGMHLGVESWAMDNRHGATTANAKRYIDFAAKHNIQGVVFEGWNKGWETWGTNQSFDFTAPYADFNIDEIARYAKEKNVEIIGHHETGGNIDNYEAQLDKAYSWYDSLGIHYVKTGYAGGIPHGWKHHGQEMVNHYRKVVEVAARYKTNLDVHEPIKPTGIRRTYPNMMTREGARGMEWNAWSEGNSPTHTMTLPYTRLLAGPMDYTPGTFDILFDTSKNSPLRKKWNDLDKGNSRVHTTLARQIADWVILYSPLQMASDRIEAYEHHPAFQFFEDFDADCDWSQALDGEIGKSIAIVRRSKDRYFLGVGTNEEERSMDIDLNFLEDGKQYDATIYADADDADYLNNPTAYVILHRQVKRGEHLTAKMARGGGMAVVFKPISEQ